jgi:glycosyltransferase involved in cell wall biosynthesis
MCLRVLQVTPHYFPSTGGTQTHVHEVGRQLARLGVHVTVLTTDLSGRLPPTEESEGILIRRVRVWSVNKERDYLHLAPDIYRVVRHGGWDIVHCQGLHTLVPPIAMLAALRARIPYVVSFHSGGNSSRLRMALQTTEWHALRPLLVRAKRLICPSKWEAEYFRLGFGLRAGPFAIIPNGANHLSAHLPEATGATRAVATSPLIVSVGRLELYKGHHRVIAALPQMREQVPNIRLRIVGSGPYESVLRKLAHRWGVADHVEIRAVPPRDQSGMASVLAQADVVTLLSEHEAQGIVVLEALALKRPVLVAYTTGLREFADRGLARAVRIDGTPGEVAAAIIDQIRNPVLPDEVELPTWERCASDLLEVYREILSEHHAYERARTAAGQRR